MLLALLVQQCLGLKSVLHRCASLSPQPEAQVLPFRCEFAGRLEPLVPLSEQMHLCRPPTAEQSLVTWPQGLFVALVAAAGDLPLPTETMQESERQLPAPKPKWRESYFVCFGCNKKDRQVRH